MPHILIHVWHPRKKRYPKKKELPWLTGQARIRGSEVAWWRRALGSPPKGKDSLEVVGPTSRDLIRVGKLVKRFLTQFKVEAKVAIGLGAAPRYERHPRRRIVLGSPSLLQALHETSHARFGRSEAIACAWSTRMFYELFPESRGLAKFHRHMITNEGTFTKFCED